MKIRIVSVGKLKEQYWKTAQKEYIKRISPFARIEILELSDERVPSALTEKAAQAILKKEGERIVPAIRGFKSVFALAAEGEAYDSLAFAEKIGAFSAKGTDLAFLIGSSLGLSEKIKSEATERLSLSKLTFPHRLVRIILLEQLYRSFKIVYHQTYHK